MKHHQLPQKFLQHRAVGMVIFRTEIFDNLKSGGKNLQNQYFGSKNSEYEIYVIFFSRETEKTTICLGVEFSYFVKKEKIPSSPTSFFSYTINNAHEAVNALRKIDLQIQQKVMNSVNLLRS